MSSESMRDPITDPLLTPKNAVLVVIDYQPTQVNSTRSMDHATRDGGEDGAGFRAAVDALGTSDFYDRTTINAWEDVEFRRTVEATGRRNIIMTALWTDACLTFPTLDAIRGGGIWLRALSKPNP